MNCKSCKDTGILKAWNKYYDSFHTQYSFRCHCTRGFTHQETNVPQWNDLHTKTFIISYSPDDSPHTRTRTKNTTLVKEPEIDYDQRITKSKDYLNNVIKNDIEKDKSRIIELMNSKDFNSTEFKLLITKHGRETMIKIYKESIGN